MPHQVPPRKCGKNIIIAIKDLFGVKVRVIIKEPTIRILINVNIGKKGKQLLQSRV